MRRWFGLIAARTASSTELDAGDLRLAWRADAAVAAGGVIVADIFLAFHECPRGYTPAFASGPFDALDASQPSRVRDGYELSLVLRTEADGDLPVASDPWEGIAGATVADRLAAAEQAAFELWHQAAQPAPENAAGVDPTAVLLARLRIPAQQNPSVAEAPIPDWSAAVWPDEQAHVDNRVRHVLLRQRRSPHAAPSASASLTSCSGLEVRVALNTLGSNRDQLIDLAIAERERLINQEVLVGDPRRWRPRWFDGRFLAASDLQGEQNYFLVRQADLGRAGGSGVIDGLMVSEAVDAGTGTERLRITPARA